MPLYRSLPSPVSRNRFAAVLRHRSMKLLKHGKSLRWTQSRHNIAEQNYR